MSAREEAERLLAEVHEIEPGSALNLVIRDNFTSVLTDHEARLRTVLRALLAEAEPEWEYRVVGDWMMYGSLDELREDFRASVATERRRKAGPWEEVTE